MCRSMTWSRRVSSNRGGMINPTYPVMFPRRKAVCRIVSPISSECTSYASTTSNRSFLVSSERSRSQSTKNRYPFLVGIRPEEAYGFSMYPAASRSFMSFRTVAELARRP